MARSLLRALLVFETYYMQVLSLGLLWTFFHCSGMCGPLVAGLTSRANDPPQAWRRVGRRATRVLAYQSGRAATYAAMGALAGGTGALFEGAVREVAALSGFVLAPVIAAVALARLTGRHLLPADVGRHLGSRLGGALRAAQRLPLGRTQFMSSALTGMAMGLLPCALMFWTLGIAATTASPLHGAGVMVTLVLLTTPTLLAAGCAASVWRITWSDRAVGVVLLVSAAWMLLVALAANDYIAHAEITFRLFDRPFMLMLF